jgi:large subunit ribosomal protein L31e
VTESKEKADEEEVTEEETEAVEGEEVSEEEIETVDEEKVEEKIEEEKPVEKKKVEIEEERVYTIPLKRAWTSKRPIRSPKAMKIIKSFVTSHMKSEEIKIDSSLNSIIWARGIEKPPRKVRVRVTRDKEGTVNVYPLEEALTKQTKG